MDPAGYRRLQALFDEARGLERSLRAELVLRVRREDAELGAELAGLCETLDELAGESFAPQVGARQLLAEEAIRAARAGLEDSAVVAAAGWLPERVGPYRILRRIGRGGMGVVYEAEQDSPRRRVALKLIPPASGSDERRKRFELEGEVLGRLHHPGIAQIYECGTFDLGHGPQPFFAMEFVEGVDLCSHAQRASLGMAEKLELVARVADAVQHAHERGVVHRDLKPDNVLVDEAGTPKVLDFGVARASDTSTLLSTMVSRTGELVGTLAYMAPEQLSREQAITPRADVYALGVILYRLLASRLPHEIAGLPLTAALRVLAHDEPTTLPHIDPRTRGEVATIVARAMEKDPGRRYASAAALAADLRRHLEHRPITARPASATYRLVKLLRRNRVLALGVGGVIAALLVGLAGTLWQARAARRSELLALREVYSANLFLADSAIERIQLGAARVHLDAAPTDLRGWEWRVLDAGLETWAYAHARSVPNVASDGGILLDLVLAPDARSYWTLDAAQGGKSRRWDLTTGDLLAEFAPPDPAGATHRAALSPDGSTLFQTSFPVIEGVPKVRWAATRFDPGGARGTEVASTRDLDVRDVADVELSPDGTIWLRRVENGTIGLLHRTVVGETPVTDGELQMNWSSSSFSPDGRLVALADDGGNVSIRSSATLEELATVGGQSDVRGAAFAADGKRLVTCSSDTTAILWDLESRPARALATLDHPNQVFGAAFGPDGTRLATLAIDRTIRVWDAGSGRLLESFGSNRLVPTTLAFFSADEVAGIEEDGSLRAWRVGSASTRVLAGHCRALRGAVPLVRSGLIASGAWDGFSERPGSLRLWDAESGDEVALLLEPGEAVCSLDAAQDGVTVAALVRGESTEVLILDTSSARLRRIPSKHAVALAFDETGARVAAVGPDTAQVLDTSSGEELASLPAEATTCSARWSRTGAFLAIGNADGPDVSLFDGRSLEELRRLDCACAEALAFSPDERRLATGGRDGIVRVWDVESGALLGNLVGHDLRVLALAFSPDGTRLASGGLDHLIYLWDASTFDVVARLSGHTDHVASLVWDGERLISSSGDDTVRIWEPVPLRVRIAARDERRTALARVEPLVAQLFAELSSPERVMAALDGRTELSPLERKVAREVALHDAFVWPEPK